MSKEFQVQFTISSPKLHLLINASNKEEAVELAKEELANNLDAHRGLIRDMLSVSADYVQPDFIEVTGSVIEL